MDIVFFIGQRRNATHFRFPMWEVYNIFLFPAIDNDIDIQFANDVCAVQDGTQN